MPGRSGYSGSFGIRQPLHFALANGSHPLCPSTAWIFDSRVAHFRQNVGGANAILWAWFDRVRGKETFLTLQTAPHSIVGGKGGQCLKTVSGQGLYVPSPVLSGSVGSFACRVNSTGFTTFYQVLYAADSVPKGIYLTTAGLMTWFDTSDHLGTTILSANTWYDLVVTSNGTSKKFYINGRLDASFALSSNWPSVGANDPTLFGPDAGGTRGFNGSVEYAYMYTNELTSGQVSALHQRPYSWLRKPLHGSVWTGAAVAAGEGYLIGGGMVGPGGVM